MLCPDSSRGYGRLRPPIELPIGSPTTMPDDLCSFKIAPRITDDEDGRCLN